MIHFHLICDKAHEFDGWFRSGKDFDTQCAAGLVSCPFCGSTKIHKALMTPAIAVSNKKKERHAQVDNEPSKNKSAENKVIEERGIENRPIRLSLSEDERAFLQVWREAAKKIRQNADYVGNNFAEEARKIHFGENKARAIYGEAHAQEVSSLLEEGINVIPLPSLPEEKN